MSVRTGPPATGTATMLDVLSSLVAYKHAIEDPSGENAGTYAVWSMSIVASPPSIGTIQILQDPVRSDANATDFPSGEHVGWRSSGPLVNCRTLPPSAFIL